MKDLHEDNLFGSVRERLGRYEEAPSEALWEKIASQQKRPKAVGLAWFEGFTVGILLMMGVIIFNDFGQEVETAQDVPGGSMAVPETHQTGTAETGKSPARGRMITSENENSRQPLSSKAIQTSSEPVQQTEITNPGIARMEDLPVDFEQNSEMKDQTSAINHPVEADSGSITSPVKPQQDRTPNETVPPYKKPKSRFQLYISVIPSLSFQKMFPSDNDQVIVQGLEHTPSLSMKRFGFGVDAGFQKEINNIFGYYGGLSFYRQQQQLTYRYFNREGDVTRVGDEWTFEINRPQYTRTFDYSMTNIGARSGVLITLKGEKLMHKAGAGLMYSYNLNSVRSGNYVATQVFYRNEVKLNDWWSWFVEPTFTYSLMSKENLGEPFQLKPYRVGISLGALYRF